MLAGLVADIEAILEGAGFVGVEVVVVVALN